MNFSRLYPTVGAVSYKESNPYADYELLRFFKNLMNVVLPELSRPTRIRVMTRFGLVIPPPIRSISQQSRKLV